MIRPYIEEERLYKQFKLDEPWDSDHNKKLINRMPNTYKNPALKLENGKTTYVVPTGKETIFANPAKGVKLNEINDGTSNTLITMEVPASMAVTWTKPEDWDGGTAGAIEKLLAAVKDGFNVGFGDGSVRYMNKKIDPKVLKAILTPDGGETVEIP
jgi:prepilin-type processing-associated H-X9-DG protein